MNVSKALATSLLRSMAGFLSGQDGRTSLLILIFHRVLERPDALLPGEPDAEAFRRLMEVVAKHFNVLPLREAIARLTQSDLPKRSVCVTFDDGYANNCEIALPILIRFGIPATAFIASGFLNGGRMFNDSVIEAVRGAQNTLDLRSHGLGEFPVNDETSRVGAIDTLIGKLKYMDPEVRATLADRICQAAEVESPRNLMMTDAQVKKLHSSGIEIGAHTVSHPILSVVDRDRARREIRENKAVLESITGAPVTTFAFPNGRPGQDYRLEHVELVRAAGFKLALSTAWGAAHHESDVFQLPRVAPWDKDPLRYGLRMAMAYRQRRYAAV